jgi:hypothetical protein
MKTLKLIVSRTSLVLAVINLLIAVGGCLWMIIATTFFAKQGHLVDAGQHGLGLLWSGLILTVCFTAIYIITDD